MKILVTGSTGHLGEGLVRQLSSVGHETIGIDLKASNFSDHLGSILDRKLVQSIMPGVDVVMHTATLHKPHLVTHSKSEFLEVNVQGTLVLLEEAVRAGVKSFIFTSTTSTFGTAMHPGDSDPAIWVTEDLVPIPKNIYGITKIAAEQLCALFHKDFNLPCIILRTSRFFAEADDNPDLRNNYLDVNIKANEYLYRRVDVEDVVSAHILAMEKAADIGFGKYIISATTPFKHEDTIALQQNASSVISRLFPDFEALYQKNGWLMFPAIGRVYDSSLAQRELGWMPKYDFRHVLNCLKAGKDYRSAFGLSIKQKGYHDQTFEDGPYPV